MRVWRGRRLFAACAPAPAGVVYVHFVSFFLMCGAGVLGLGGVGCVGFCAGTLLDLVMSLKQVRSRGTV